MVEGKSIVLFRVEGNSKVGLGHLIRCLAMSRMLKPYFDSIFAIREVSIAMGELIQEEGTLHLITAENTDEEFQELIPLLNISNICVLDGYNFSEEYQKFIVSRHVKLVYVDDMFDRHYYSHLVINHGCNTAPINLSCESYTKLLLGLDYLIVRNEFLSGQTHAKAAKCLNTIFISMGGADPNDITARVFRACLKVRPIKEIIVVVGDGYSNNADKFYEYGEDTNKKISIYQNIRGSQMAELIRSADVSIVPASTTSLEICCVNSGLITGLTFGNQHKIHDEIVRSGMGVSIGDFNSFEEHELVELLSNLTVENINQQMVIQRNLIDRKSGERIRLEFHKIIAA